MQWTEGAPIQLGRAVKDGEGFKFPNNWNSLSSKHCSLWYEEVRERGHAVLDCCMLCMLCAAASDAAAYTILLHDAIVHSLVCLQDAAAFFVRKCGAARGRSPFTLLSAAAAVHTSLLPAHHHTSFCRAAGT